MLSDLMLALVMIAALIFIGFLIASCTTPAGDAIDILNTVIP